ncbi:protodermal factor 1 [Malania oleifera]|uniref:protodermal factor 1 n=1 Tax=Malania oleifera TaxID=397392 RepID=UPI0025AE8F78|nr:protodermal factor 1 [Malania oleifera]
MDSQHKFLLAAFLILASAIGGAQAYAMVSGTVFCDQCKDGQISLFDYPLNGAKVMVACADSNGQVTMWREETTNWFGCYSMKFDGTPDLSSCYAQVSGSGQGSKGCGAAPGPAQNLRLTFSMFDMEIYTVDSLLSQPAQPMSFCPGSSSPAPGPVTPTRPPTPYVPAPVTTPPSTNPPVFRLPPMPHLPPLPRLPPMPPVPFLEASACPFDKWTMTQYKCYWKVLSPGSKVALVFGPVVARRYGTDITLWKGLQGKGDPYRTLLREGTTALLNSYNSLQFPYHTLGVVQHMNWALMGSPKDVLLTALRFKRANSGSSNVTCKFTPCK